MTVMVSREKIANAVVRLVFACVFAVNVHCALSFLLTPESFVAGFMLQDAGQVGRTAVAGLGIAFLMWNATYPMFIAFPARYPVLGWIVLAQQAIGLLGETYLYICSSAAGALEPLRASILRFMVFDGAGLAAMGAAFAWFLSASAKRGVL